jgi:hypothetical protein
LSLGWVGARARPGQSGRGELFAQRERHTRSRPCQLQQHRHVTDIRGCLATCRGCYRGAGAAHREAPPCVRASSAAAAAAVNRPCRDFCRSESAILRLAAAVAAGAARVLGTALPRVARGASLEAPLSTHTAAFATPAAPERLRQLVYARSLAKISKVAAGVSEMSAICSPHFSSGIRNVGNRICYVDKAPFTIKPRYDSLCLPRSSSPPGPRSSMSDDSRSPRGRVRRRSASPLEQQDDRCAAHALRGHRRCCRRRRRRPCCCCNRPSPPFLRHHGSIAPSNPCVPCIARC